MLKKLIGCTLASFILGLASLSGTALAIPALQLDIVDDVAPGGHYKGSPDETTFSASDTFTLYALFCPQDTQMCQNSKLDLNKKYYIAAALIQVQPTQSVAQIPSGGLGSFVFNGQTINVNSTDMTYGVPTTAAGDVPKHGIYETFFKVFEFMFDPNVDATPYDVPAVNPPSLTMHPGPDGAGTGMYYRAFDVDVTGIQSGPDGELYDLHFDLYGIGEMCIGRDQQNCMPVLDVAPFSHDAQGYRVDAPRVDAPVPEPSTVLLVGAGVVGLGLWRRQKRNRRV